MPVEPLDDEYLARLEAIAARFEALRGPQAPKNRARGDQHPVHLHPELAKRGAEHPSAKLTEDDVREIRLLSAQGHSRKTVARRFGVTPTCIQHIVAGRTWKHVPFDPGVTLDPLLMHLQAQRRAAQERLRAQYDQ